ncbi:MAG: glycosyl transferase, group 1 [Cyanobacteria bacterium RYN_339]|nr:glycosyl transferase, group 1 [Cyanobacteria bacterium RYN_339]
MRCPLGCKAIRVVAVCPAYPPDPGGVSDYARRWAVALAAAGLEVTVITRPGPHAEDAGVDVRAVQADWGFGGMKALRGAIAAARPDVVVLHYVPHLYQRRGLSLAVNHALGGLGAPLVTLAHEIYYARHEGLRRQPIGWLQRYALRPLFAASRRVVLTVPDRVSRMQAVFPRWRDRFALIPVGGNLDPTGNRAAWRAAQGLAPDALALLFLGLAHPSKELGHLGAALDAVDGRLFLAGGATLPGATSLGYVSPAEAADALAGADLFLLPLADGASTRRTSLMNALAAGLPVVSTLGVNTDEALFRGAVRLVPAGDAAAFAGAVRELALDPAARAALGAAGRALYEREFAWPVLAGRWKALLEGTLDFR